MMCYRFTLVSDEEESFFREIIIPSNATFLDLSNAILDACHYSDDQLTSFYICDEGWEKRTEVTREDMGNDSLENDSYVMGNTSLDQLVDEDNPYLRYIFDPYLERGFFVQLKEVFVQKETEKAVCTRSRGEAPAQVILKETDLLKIGKGTSPMNDFQTDDDSFLGEGFNSDELDLDGFEISEGNPWEN